MPFNKNLRQQTLSQKQFVITQTEQLEDPSQPDPMIDYGAEHLIDFGVVLLAVTVILIIGMISQQMKNAILFALGLSTFLIIILWYI